MAMKRTKAPWMAADDFGRSLPRGIGVNLLVRDLEAELGFCREVLGAMVLYGDEDFAAIELCGSVFMLHADHAYADHPMSGVVAGVDVRGRGMEVRVYGLDPDKAEQRARVHDAVVLSGSIDKPHGLRECHLVDPEGYVWVPAKVIKAEGSKA